MLLDEEFRSYVLGATWIVFVEIKDVFPVLIKPPPNVVKEDLRAVRHLLVEDETMRLRHLDAADVRAGVLVVGECLLRDLVACGAPCRGLALPVLDAHCTDECEGAGAGEVALAGGGRPGRMAPAA